MLAEQNSWQVLNESVELSNTKIAVWGWGSIEQHGPRMPLETDTLLAEFFSELINRVRPSCFKYPTVPLGMSRHHEAFPGTWSLSDVTATGLAVEVLRSAHRSGFRKIFVVLGHGGNRRPFEAACTIVGNELKGLQICQPLLKLFYRTEGELGTLLTSFGEDVSHAGAAECSLVWAILERMGRWQEAERYRSVQIHPSQVTLGAHGVGTEGGSPEEFRRMFPSGSKGDQTKADLDKGRLMLELFEREMVQAFDEFTAK